MQIRCPDPVIIATTEFPFFSATVSDFQSEQAWNGVEQGVCNPPAAEASLQVSRIPLTKMPLIKVPSRVHICQAACLHLYGKPELGTPK